MTKNEVFVLKKKTFLNLDSKEDMTGVLWLTDPMSVTMKNVNKGKTDSLMDYGRYTNCVRKLFTTPFF